MKKRKTLQISSVDLELMEKWLKNYFLDPFTSWCDLTQFQIDLYETDEEWIVEALLNEYVSYEITVKAEDKQLFISAQKHSYSLPSPFPKKTRTIDFPFLIIKHHITASFNSGILEIFISKTQTGTGKNRYITLL